MIIYWKETFAYLEPVIERANRQILEDKAKGELPKQIRELKGTHKHLLHEMIKAYGGQLVKRDDLFQDELLPSFQTNNPNLAKRILRSPRTVQRCISDLQYAKIITHKQSHGPRKNYYIRFHPSILIGRCPASIEAIENELRQIEKTEHEDYLVALLRTKCPPNDSGNLDKESIKDVEENSGGQMKVDPEIANDKQLKKLAPEFWRSKIYKSRNTRATAESSGAAEKIPAAPKIAPAANETRATVARTNGKAALSRWMRPVAAHPTFMNLEVPEISAPRLSQLLQQVHMLWALCFTHLYRHLSFLAVREQIHAKFYFLTKLILASDSDATFRQLQARIIEAGRYCKEHNFRVPIPSAYFDDSGGKAVSFAKTEVWIRKKYNTHAEWETLRDQAEKDLKAYRGLLNALDKTREKGTVRQYKNGLRHMEKYGNEQLVNLYNQLVTL